MDHSAFETGRLRLEPVSETKHFEGFHAIWTDERCALWSLRGTTKSEEDSRQWMQGVLPSPNKLNFAVVLQLGYTLNANYWGQGYATEALRTFIPTFFERRPEVKEIRATVDPENHASTKVLEKLGQAVLPLLGPEPRPMKPLVFSLSRDT
ncbi:acyl-CoA N-acyltransferase [Flagelloscypha sp. PMI_526]|nr:acyl-CoA N-acyltransferase [Flagelloscypha sp. PMI_526]